MDLYAGDSIFSVDKLLADSENFQRSFQGKFHVDKRIRDKIQQRQKLDPEEYKINYRSKVVRHHQKRAMDHIFGDRRFKLQDLDELCRWMVDEEAEDKFLNSQLVTGPDGTRNEPLSDSTIATLARCIIQLLNYVKSFYSDMSLQEAMSKALTSVHGIENNAGKRARNTTIRQGYMDKENYVIPILEIKKFTESKVHMKVLQLLLKLSEMKDEEERDNIMRCWTRQDVYNVQCHIAVLMTMHTGKRPGVLCGLRIENVLKAEQAYTEDMDENDEIWRITVMPVCQFTVFKTVSVAHLTMSVEVLNLLDALCTLRSKVDGAQEDDRVFTSVTGCGLKDLCDEVKVAWKSAKCESRFTSTKMWHTIVTAAMDLQNKCSEEELKALVRGMDHSIQIAELKYAHSKEQRQTDHSKGPEPKQLDR